MNNKPNQKKKTMNKTLFALLPIAMFCIAFSSCKDDEDGKLDKDAKIYINGRDNLGNKNLQYNKEGKLTAHEICLLDTIILSTSNNYGEETGGRGFLGANHIDTINDRFIMEAGNLTTLDDNPFINAEYAPHAYFTKEVYDRNGEWIGRDTIAYIPRAQRLEAYYQIRELWDKDEWDKMYKIFEDGLIFVPCTGAEYKALVEAGIE